MPAKYEWDPAPPTRRQRITAGLFLVVLVVTSASYYLDWRLFGEYDKQTKAIVVFVGIIWFVRFMPGVRRQ